MAVKRFHTYTFMYLEEKMLESIKKLITSRERNRSRQLLLYVRSQLTILNQQELRLVSLTQYWRIIQIANSFYVSLQLQIFNQS